jgi:hypothetical protein
VHHSISRRFSWLNLLIIASVVLITLARCSSESDQPSYVEVQSKVPTSVDEIPTIQGETIFDISNGVLTGDYSPNAFSLMLSMLAVLGLTGIRAMAIRRSKTARSPQ